MTRWWTKLPIIVAALGVLAVLITALLPRTTITQQTSGAGSPAIGSAGGNITITQQHDLQSPAAQPPATTPAPATLSRQPWWQQPPVIAAIIAAIATLVAALIQRARATSPAEPPTRRQRRKP
jgi:hypothetical protein